MFTLRGVALNNTRSSVPLVAAIEKLEELHLHVWLNVRTLQEQKINSIGQSFIKIRNHLKRPKNYQFVTNKLAGLCHKPDTENSSSSPGYIGSF